ncbi:MAG: protein kinase [Alphaproteobacteria bacterium]|nr:protein kinase [Alphaproteobacteria bacterium]
MSPPPARRYELVEALGKGGFGTVYRARLTGPEGFTKDVALKVLHDNMSANPEVAGRLRDEARVLGLVRHRAIVHVHDLCCLDGRWSVVMEYIEGADLSRLLRVGSVPPGPALEIIQEVAAALHAAWTAQGPDGEPLHIRHRDLKPGNIRVTRHGEVKILDFGIARADFAAREVQTGSVLFGTPAFMSPERLDFADGPAADIYALGCILFQMLHGERFGRTHVSRPRHERKVHDRINALGDAVSPQLRALLRRLLDWDPEHRPTAEELEELCRAARRGDDGPSLRRWAQDTLLEAARQHPRRPPALPVGADLTGSVLVEVSSGTLISLDAVSDGKEAPAPTEPPEPEDALPSPPPARDPEPAKPEDADGIGRRVGLFVMLASLSLIGTVGLGWSWLSAEPEASTPVEQPVETDAVVAVALPEEPEAPGEVAPPTPAEDEPSEEAPSKVVPPPTERARSAPAQKPDPAPVVEASDPEPEPPPPMSAPDPLRFVADTPDAWFLVDAHQAVLSPVPAQVPPGTYMLHFTFGEREGKLRVEIGADQRVGVRCVRSASACVLAN